MKRITRFSGSKTQEAALYFYEEPFYDKSICRHYPADYVGKFDGTVAACAKFLRDCRRSCRRAGGNITRDPEQLQTIIIHRNK